MIMMSLPMTIVKSLIDQESIQPDRFTNLTFLFFVKGVLFYDIMTSCSQCRTEITTKIGDLAILALCVDEILEEKA